MVNVNDIQIGDAPKLVFRSKEDAEALADNLEADGFVTEIVNCIILSDPASLACLVGRAPEPKCYDPQGPLIWEWPTDQGWKRDPRPRRRFDLY